MSQASQVRLGVNVLASGRHDAAWKTWPDAATLSTVIDAFIRIAQGSARNIRVRHCATTSVSLSTQTRASRAMRCGKGEASHV